MAGMQGKWHGILLDTSHYDEKENKAKTKDLTAFQHERGIVAEAEPDRTHDGEKGFVADTGKLEAVLTTTEQAEEFIALGIDWLAPALENHHGNYGHQGPQLGYQRLSRIHEVAKGKVQLVLHGTNDFDETIFQKCIKGDVAKCNINNIMNDIWTEVQRTKAGAFTHNLCHRRGDTGYAKGCGEVYGLGMVYWESKIFVLVATRI